MAENVTPAEDPGKIEFFAQTELRLWDLLNIPQRASLDLWELLHRSPGVADARRALTNHSLASQPAAVVLVAATALFRMDPDAREAAEGRIRRWRSTTEWRIT